MRIFIKSLPGYLRIYALPVLALAVVSCNSAGSDGRTEAPTVMNAAAIASTATLPPPTPSLESPTPTPIPPTQATVHPTPEPVRLEGEPYTHPAGLFRVHPPEGWDIVEESPGLARLEPPDQSGAIYLRAINTGYPLDPAAFARLVTARERSQFSSYTDYVEIEREQDPQTGAIRISKRLILDDVPWNVVSYYRQEDQGVLILDFWIREDLQPRYENLLDELIAGVEADSQAIAEQAVYAWVYPFRSPRGLFTIDIPVSWTQEKALADFVEADTFRSPDERATIQSIVYDDGQPVSHLEAGAFAVQMLRNSLGGDVVITSDRVQPDGSERLVWYSPGRDIRGTSFFENRGTTLLLLSVYYDQAYEEHYRNLLNYIISTYTAP